MSALRLVSASTWLAATIVSLVCLGGTLAVPPAARADADSSIEIAAFGPGVGTITDDQTDPSVVSLGINCHYDNGVQTGTCRGAYTAFPAGIVVILTYTPDKGYYACLEGGCGGIDQSWSDQIPLSPDDQFTIGPDFQIAVPKLHITGSGTGTGRVTATNQVNACPTCTINERYCDTVNLEALPDPGSIFGGWTGPCAGQDSTCSFEISVNATVDARFDLVAPATPAPTHEPTPAPTDARPTAPLIAPTTPPPAVTPTPVAATAVASAAADASSPSLRTSPPVVPAQLSATDPTTIEQRDDRPLYIVLAFVAAATTALAFQFIRRRLQR